MREFEKIVGTPFTRRKTTHFVTETADEIEAAVRLWLGAWTEDPWAVHRRDVEEARVALASEIAAKPDGYMFKEREDVGWYLQRLVKLGAVVQHHIDRGAPSWAAHEAALFGETLCELQMKLARERLWNTGKKIHDGGAASRRGPSADRVSAVEALTTGPEKISKRKAFEIVAACEDVTPKAIETDYYKAKNIVLKQVIRTLASR